MAKKTTPHNTGLSISRKGSRFTASWKIATKDADKQEVRYRTYNGKKWSKWTEKKVGKKTTSYSFSLSASKDIENIQVQTRILRTPTTDWAVSSWSDSSAKWTVDKPPMPKLSVSNDSANQTTFSWSISSSDTNHEWLYRCMYRTKCTVSPALTSGWGAWTHAATSSYTYTDNTTGRTRAFQIKAVGPGGESKKVSGRHYIGAPPVPKWQKKRVSCAKKGSYYQMTYRANITGSEYRIDKIVPQYYIGTPTAGMDCPSGVSWQDGPDYAYDSAKHKYALALTTNSLIGEDQCLFARVTAEHDGLESSSDAHRVLTGRLKAPTANISMTTPTISGFTVSITITDIGTAVPGAYVEVYLEKRSKAGVKNYIKLGTIPNGTMSATISSTLNITGETGYAIHIRNVSQDGKTMTSAYYTYKTSMPAAPTSLLVEPTTTSDKVYVSWTNNWSDATGVIIAWTDDPDNWTSNDEPESYEIGEPASGWFITGLETGKVWYFRVRSVETATDSVTYSPWSDEYEIDLASAPAVPVLYLSEEVITETGMVTAYWSYVTTDGTAQISGEVVEATYSGGSWTYSSTPAGVTSEEQHVDIYAQDCGWTNDSTVYLALRTQSGSGGTSDYSTPVKLVIAATPTVSISSTGLAASDTVTEYFLGDGATVDFICSHDLSASPTATVEGSAVTVSSYSDSTVTLTAAPADGDEVAITYTTTDNKVLTAMPLSVTVAATNAERVSIAIERAANYPMLRPDGDLTTGPEGETVYLVTLPIASSITQSIALDDMIGRLDDGAYYNLVVTSSDGYGQEAKASQRFIVHWSHQAWEPTATFVTDAVDYIAKITPVAGADYQAGDTCDIYRLSSDKPELIVQGASFGTQYVDPYPAFGVNSGYKIVTVTENGDYIMDPDNIADYDTTLNSGVYTQLDPETVVIDFGGDRVELPYNITLGNSWTKDFQRTSYLGGHVAGDHNVAVTRDLSVGTVLARVIDEDTAVTLRALARYPGLCHVRTPEGSSFTADVQVSENRGFDSGIIEYGLTIQKVDPVGFDGMTYTEWSEMA